MNHDQNIFLVIYLILTPKFILNSKQHDPENWMFLFVHTGCGLY